MPRNTSVGMVENLSTTLTITKFTIDSLQNIQVFITGICYQQNTLDDLIFIQNLTIDVNAFNTR